MTEHTTIEQIDNQNQHQDEQQNTPQAETNVEPTREQLMERYEQRVRPAMLESAEATTSSTNFTGLLQSEGLGVLDGADLIPGGAEERAPLYLRTPVGEGNSEGIDIPQARVTVDSQEDAEIQPETCPVLSPDDQGLMGTQRDLGHAATFSEAAYEQSHAGSAMDRLAGGDFAENGTAFYRSHRGHTLLALAGANEGDLDRAANRAEAERIGVAFDGSVSVVSALAGTLVERLGHLGGSSSLDGAVRSLADLGYSREAIRAVMAELYRRGLIRLSIRGTAPEGGGATERDTRPRFVTLANAPEGALAAAAKRYADDQKEIPERRKTAADLARMRGQDKGFLAPFVPFGGTKVNAAEQARALYIERAKERYNGADLKGIHKVTLRLAANGDLPATEETLYEADAWGTRDFFRAALKARILTGLERNGVLSASRIVSVLFPVKAQEIISLLRGGRTLSPQLAEPYAMFTSAVAELVEEGKAARTREGRLALADPDKLPVKQTKQKEVKDWADEDPEPERESGPDAHGADKYASDMAGAHDHRAIATGPQAPSRRPGGSFINRTAPEGGEADLGHDPEGQGRKGRLRENGGLHPQGRVQPGLERGPRALHGDARPGGPARALPQARRRAAPGAHDRGCR